MTIYLMYSAKTTQYKIGYTGRVSPQMRLQELQTRKGTIGGNDPTITLVAHWRGTKRLEKFLHRRLSPYRVKGEWFRLQSVHVILLQQFMRLVHLETVDEGAWNRLYLKCVKEV